MTRSMIGRLSILGAVAILVAMPANAQTQSFDTAAYVTCREAQNLAPAARKSLALFLAEHAARHHGVTIPEDQRGGTLGLLVRGGCTLEPDAYLFTVIDRAIEAEIDKLPKR